MLQSVILKPTSRRFRKPISKVVLAALLIFMAVLEYGKYRATGRFLVYDYSLSGQNAKLALLASIFITLGYSVFAVISVVKTARGGLWGRS
jgi:hypothetical protein